MVKVMYEPSRQDPSRRKQRGIRSPGPRILVLDLGVVEAGVIGPTGKILELTPHGNLARVLAQNQLLPDGVDVHFPSNRIFWTNMGNPGEMDGSVQCANVDGTEIRTIISPGHINTPKQLVVDSDSQRLYFADREGMRIWSCDLNGNKLEVLVEAGTNVEDPTCWCVGVQKSKRGKLYWTQKGASNSGKGRIFSIDIARSERQPACLLDNLPEPVDLALDSDGTTLFWTDRGDIPHGNSLNKVALDRLTGLLKTIDTKPQVILRGLHAPVGLKLDEAGGHIYVGDLGGALYRCNFDGSGRQLLYSGDDHSFTGIGLLDNLV